MSEQEEIKKCNPLNCKTFSSFAYRKVKGPLGLEFEMEQLRPMDTYAAACPYRGKGGACENYNETLKGKTY